jgi:(2Fe-2S) ferredoxin
MSTKRIWVCINGNYCCKLKPQRVLDALNQEIVAQEASEQLEAIGGGCLGMCGEGPNAMVVVNRTRTGYCHVKPKDAKEIVAAHKGEDKPV